MGYGNLEQGEQKRKVSSCPAIITVGIDYSINSPAVCVHQGQQWNYKSCRWLFLTKHKARLKKLPRFIKGVLIPDQPSEIDHFLFLAKKVVGFIKPFTKKGPVIIGIEGYSFDSTGKVFQLAENCGILKSILITKGLSFNTFPPMQIKKYATGTGVAGKYSMGTSFYKETSLDLKPYLSLKESSLPDTSPLSDIIDAYYIAKYTHFTVTNQLDTKRR